MEVENDKLKTERIHFEKWCKSQFNLTGNDLIKNLEGEYVLRDIGNLFIGFCAGYNTYKQQDSVSTMDAIKMYIQ